MMLQTQNLPPLTAFNLAWSIQLEFFLYLFFPVLFTFLANSKIFLPVLLFLTLRITLSYVSTEAMREIAFSTFMGAGSYFYMGMVFQNYIKRTASSHLAIQSLTQY